MARKSAQQRIKEGTSLLTEYRTAGLIESYWKVVNFLETTVNKIKNKRALTTRQRAFFDKLIDEGVPELKGDKKFSAKITEAIETEGFDQRSIGILKDFRAKVNRGWDLSEKQKAWCNKLLESAKSIRHGTNWRPNEETTERIKLALSVSSCYNSIYWETHGGGAKARQLCSQWVKGDLKHIDEWVVNAFFKAVKGRLRQLEEPKFFPGQKVWQRQTLFDGDGWETISNFGIVISGPTVINHSIAYSVLINGNISELNIESMRKRK